MGNSLGITGEANLMNHYIEGLSEVNFHGIRGYAGFTVQRNDK